MRTTAVLALLVLAVAAPPLVGAAPRPAERAAAVPPAVPVKPTGPIAVEYRVAKPPAVGEALEIDVTARVEAAPGSLTIEANPTAPRSVLVTPPVLVTAGDGVFTWRIAVVPLAADAGYLSVIVAANVDGLPQARSVTVSLRSAAATGPRPAAGAFPAENLVALPAQESP